MKRLPKRGRKPWGRRTRTFQHWPSLPDEAGQVLVLSFEGMRLRSSANTREHWSQRARIAKAQRGAAKLFAQSELRKSPLIAKARAWLVDITRFGPRPLDSDNLAISAKHVRDGIADALGVDDGNESKVLWTYGQMKVPASSRDVKYGVRVVICVRPEEELTYD